MTEGIPLKRFVFSFKLEKKSDYIVLQLFCAIDQLVKACFYSFLVVL